MKPLILAALIVTALNAQPAQPSEHFPLQPFRFVVSNVTVGSNKLATPWAWAEGKWSDAGPNVDPIQSAEIHCYQRLGFCEVASAYAESKERGGSAWVKLDTYDILRWDEHEMIAVDCEFICEVGTLRFDFDNKTVARSATTKDLPKNVSDTFCGAETKGTAWLIGKLPELPDRKK